MCQRQHTLWRGAASSPRSTPRPNDAAVVWLDGVVVFSASAAVDADVDSGTLGVAAGWHQLVVKFRKAPTGSPVCCLLVWTSNV